MSRAGELIAKAKAAAKDKYEAYKEEQKEKKAEHEEMEGIRKEAKEKQKEVHKVEYRKAMIQKAQHEGKAQAIRESQAKSGNFIDRLAGSIDKGARMMDFATSRPDGKNLPRIAMETRMHDNEMPNIMRMEQKHKPRPSQLDHMFFESPKKKKKQNNMWVR